MARPRATAGADRARQAATPHARRRRARVIPSRGVRGPPPPLPARPRAHEPASNRTVRPSAAVRTYRPSRARQPLRLHFASGVLRFAPALRVTGARPVAGGPDGIPLGRRPRDAERRSALARASDEPPRALSGGEVERPTVHLGRFVEVSCGAGGQPLPDRGHHFQEVAHGSAGFVGVVGSRELPQA